MPKYIDADKLGIDYANPDIFENKGYADGWNSAIALIKNAPTENVQEIRSGKWQEQYATGTYFCLECGNDALYSCIRYNSETTIKEVLSDYCPHCGAKMEGKR